LCRQPGDGERPVGGFDGYRTPALIGLAPPGLFPTRAVELQESVTASVGRPVVGFFEAVGELSLLFSRAVGAILMGRISLVETLRQMSVIGVNSLPIVL